MLAAVATLSAAQVCAGCFFPGHRTIGGVVTERSSCASSPGTAPASAAPVPKARVRLECPREGPAIDLVADAGGRFRGESLGAIPLECSVTIEAPGFVTRRYAVRDLCASDYPGPIWDNHESSCHNLYVEAALWRTPPAAGKP